MGTRSDLHTWLSGCRGLCREKSNTGWLGTVPGVDERDPGTRRRSSSGPAVWGTRVQPHGGDRPCGGGGVEQYWWGSCRWSLCKLMHLLPKDQWGSAGAPPGTDLKGVKMLDGKDVGTPPNSYLHTTQTGSPPTCQHLGRGKPERLEMCPP